MTFLAECAASGRALAVRWDRAVFSPSAPCPQAVAEHRARGMAGLRNRSFRKRSAAVRSQITLEIGLRR